MIHVPESVQRLAIEIEGWLELDLPERALAKMDDLLAVPGARPVALMLRSRAYMAAKQYGAAIADIEELRSFDHDPDEADLQEAWCHKRMDDVAAAAGCMERLIRRSNHSAIGHFNLGCYLALLGETKRAIDEITLACGIDPKFRDLLGDDDLTSLRGLSAFESLKDKS